MIMKVTHFFRKHNLISSVMSFLFMTTLVLTIISCCKEGECKCKHDCPEEPIDYTRFFIAHAGGEIDGIDYTNSLEALNLSYSKGCRLFELDLETTSDDKFVAVHDWEYFKVITNYSGTIDNTPLSEEEFLSLKIHGKYTPMNMDAVNIWFQNHKDAILVVDKSNNPRKIYNDFQFRDRVIMELFSWDKIDTAIKLGIKPMVNEYLIFGTSKKAIEMGFPPLPPLRNSDIEQILKDKKIEYICSSRYKIIANRDLFSRLKEKGIKNYVFHLQEPINGLPAEEYVWSYEMKFCYGMYANNLDLLTSLLNGETTK